jgi:RNAse (barnase) inhibitor barstar
MKKKELHFSRISEYKERFRNQPLEQLHKRLTSGYLDKEAAIAMRELIEEKEKPPSTRAIDLPFDVESMKRVLLWGATPDTSPFNHQEIAHWCDRFHMATFDADTDNAMDVATGIAADVDAQWDMYLANIYPPEELDTADFSNVQVPTKWFIEWLNQLQETNQKHESTPPT